MAGSYGANGTRVEDMTACAAIFPADGNQDLHAPMGTKR